MTRNFKALGLALVAVLALGAVVASAASAHTFHSDSSTGSTILTGEQTTVNVFTVTGASAECSKAKFSGTQSGSEAPSVTVHPVYEGKCSLEPFGEGTVDTVGCNYILSSTTDANGDAATEIECEGSNKIKVTGPLGCTISVPGGKTSGGVHYTNENPGTTSQKAVTVTATVTGISYTSNFACQLAGVPASGTNGTYTGAVTVKGFEDNAGAEGSQTGIFVE